ncbi:MULTISPECIES: hypothetical protein [Methylococcus]|uniref:hypothetical protein n=1 Tax=Methylococcus TaxID=413 RepID=UPI001C527A74|nr:hypothetical protein [Methylococcus capsulatus]QXP87247.1 hypothetical protein KW112_12855 [Methylococcus capsulatus]UQN12243.1 hypothetical protein M3M30_14610 [Methylococcus capsulatus]
MADNANSKNLCSLLIVSAGLLAAQVAQADAPCVVPLKLIDINAGSGKPPEYKLGIHVGLGGGAPQLYEFDTGGPGFWAAYTPTPPKNKEQWWGNYETVQTDALSIAYTSGNEYTANLVDTVVALYRPQGSGFAKQCESAAPVGVAQITAFADKKKPKKVKAWYKALATGKPPLFGHFYGDFGAALFPIMTADKSAGVYSVLPQLPQTGLTNGFIVHVGPLGKSKPTLTIGIADEELATFTTQLPMNPTCVDAGGAPEAPSSACPPYPNFPVGDMPTWSEQITYANLSWEYGKSSDGNGQAFSNVGLTLDTGAPATTIWQNDDLYVDSRFLRNPEGSTVPYTGDFKPKVRLTISAATMVPGGHDLDFYLLTGQKATVNQVSASVRGNDGGPTWSGYMNTGLMLYTYYDVMFDVEHGVVGFRPVKR